jgi:predicted dehydrogenase
MPERLRPHVYHGAVIGLGGVARQSHLPTYGDPRVRRRLRIAAVVDANPRVQPVGGLPLLRSPEELAHLEPLDFVDICTPTASHVDLTLWALRQGYHVLCEKPVAVTHAEAVAIGRAARAARRVVVPCHQYRHNPAWQTVRRWLDEERIGRWHLAQFEVYRLAADAGAAGPGTPWRGRRRDGLGGVLLDHGTHLIYQLLDVAGAPAAVRAWTGRLRHAAYDVEDTAQLVFEYPDRAAFFFLTWAGHRRENRIRFFGERGTIEWAGGVLTLDADGRIETHDFTAQLDKRAYAGWFAALFHDFARTLNAGDGGAPLADITRVADVLEAAYAAAAAPGTPIRPARVVGGRRGPARIGGAA